MKFHEVIEQVMALLQREGRMSYRALKREFDLDDEYLEDLKEELIVAKRLAVDEGGRVLVWTGAAAKQAQENHGNGESKPKQSTATIGAQTERLKNSRRAEGERRQLTVMFIDLVGSTILSQQLDPEEYHARVVAYQTACRQVIARYEGHVAQYLGDGILTYFGYPAAHEDDAARAVHSGLECVTAVSQLTYTPPLQVRIGVHTGPVMVGEIGAGERTERLALGETPNLAARVQGVAEPNTVFLSPATQRLVQGLFECQDTGPQTLKGIATPQSLHRVLGESAAQSRFEAAVQTGLTPLVGRESELGLLRQRWEQAKAGAGQVVLLSGEPGIGKSRLAQELKEQVSAEGATRIEFRCSPYHQSTALYPIIDHLQRLLQFQAADTPHAKLTKLTQLLSQYCFPHPETSSLLAALFSLPPPEGAPLLSFSPQKQKQLTLEALIAWLLEEAERAAVYCAWEDLHWADPSTLETLTLLLDQVPTARLYMLLTFRPEFVPPWGNRSHLSQLTVSRLERQQIEAMVEKITRGKELPAEVVQQIVVKTDGVPLFVEELTKSVAESAGAIHESPLHLGIPATLQDVLMARLDRLGAAKELAQLGATIGREFSYELIHAISPLDEEKMREGLRQLVATELVYQRGLPPQTTYLFKHALIQDTAYQSLLKRTRQQYHQQIAQVLEEQFAEVATTQPELVAQHYTEAGLTEQALGYWQKAGQRASDRSAHQEALSHVMTGLSLIQTLPETPVRQQQELPLQIALGSTAQIVRGHAAPEVEAAYTRARVLCQQLGDTQDVSPVLLGLWRFYMVRADLSSARRLGEELLGLAAQRNETSLSVIAHYAVGFTSYFLGELLASRRYFEEGIACYTPVQRSSPLFRAGQDPGVSCHLYAALTLWSLGYPDQALARAQDGLALATDLVHPFSSAFALCYTARIHQFRREEQDVPDHAAAAVTLSTEQGFPLFLVLGTIMRGWALTTQEQDEEGLRQMRHGLTAWRASGAELLVPYFLSLLAEGYARLGQIEAGLNVLREGGEVVERTGQHAYRAEMCRLYGELSLRIGETEREESEKEKTEYSLSDSPVPRFPISSPEECFLKAIEVARSQQAKSLELRATTSLAHLWQKQGKTTEARELLAPVYGWFTEGFDTKDLQDAKALLDELTDA